MSHAVQETDNIRSDGGPEDNIREFGCVLVAAQPVRRGHQHQKKELRDVDRNRQWLTLQKERSSIWLACVR